MTIKTEHIIPDINTKTTLGISVVSTLVVAPFVLNNFIQHKFILAASTTLVVLVCALNAWLCFRGRYHLWLNLFVIVPIITVAIGLSMYFLGVAGSYWVFLGIFSLYFILPVSLAWKVNLIFAAIMLAVAEVSLEHCILIRFCAVMVGTSFYAYASMREISKLYKKISIQAIKDPLTSLYNRSLLVPALDQAISLHKRNGNPMTLIMLDLDYFKLVNDTHGHDMGDQVLKEIGRFLLRNLRASDMVFRIGGEEFLILLYNTRETTGCKVAEKLRQQLAQLQLLPDKPVTASLGVVGLQDGMDRKEWLKQCDRRVYCAKSKGRNRTCTQASCPQELLQSMG